MFCPEQANQVQLLSFRCCKQTAAAVTDIPQNMVASSKGYLEPNQSHQSSLEQYDCIHMQRAFRFPETGAINLSIILQTLRVLPAHTHSPSSPMRVLSSCFPWSVGICQCSSTNRVNRDSRPDVSCCHKDDRKDRRRGGVEGWRERNIPHLTSTTVGHPWAIKFRAASEPRWRALIKWIPCRWDFREYKNWPVGQLTCWSRTWSVFAYEPCFVIFSILTKPSGWSYPSLSHRDSTAVYVTVYKTNTETMQTLHRLINIYVSSHNNKTINAKVCYVVIYYANFYLKSYVCRLSVCTANRCLYTSTKPAPISTSPQG